MAFSFVFGDELPSWCILKCMREQDHFPLAPIQHAYNKKSIFENCLVHMISKFTIEVNKIKLVDSVDIRGT